MTTKREAILQLKKKHKISKIQATAMFNEENKSPVKEKATEMVNYIFLLINPEYKSEKKSWENAKKIAAKYAQDKEVEEEVNKL